MGLEKFQVSLCLISVEIFGKILENKKGPHFILVKQFGKILRLRKNTPAEFRKILWKCRKNILESSEKYSPKTGSWRQNNFFQLLQHISRDKGCSRRKLCAAKHIV